MEIEVRVVRKTQHALPEYETDQSAGMDLRADLGKPSRFLPVNELLFRPVSTCRFQPATKRRCARAVGWP